MRESNEGIRSSAGVVRADLTAKPPEATSAPSAVGGGRTYPVLPPVARGLVRLIGRTPLLPLPSPHEGVLILGKAEWFNPGGSVKDRAAWSIVRQGLQQRVLPGRRLLDASSGNTGIAYAMLGAAIGFGVTICIPAAASRERLAILEAYGAELVVTDPLEGTDGAIRQAVALAEDEKGRFWYADQYGNDANWEAHYVGTGLEIWDQTDGRLTHFLVGVGTSGTLVGAGRRLKELDRGIRVVSVEPLEPLHAIEGLKHLETSTPPGIYDPSVADERAFVDTEEALLEAARLARESGCFVGVSSGAAYAAARRVASRIERGTLVVMLPDGGDRYLSLEPAEPVTRRNPLRGLEESRDPQRTLVLPSSLSGELGRELEAAYPNEGCGVLLGRLEEGRRVVQSFEPTRNRWSGRDDRYLVDPGALRRLLDEEDRGGYRVLGFYHSHPGSPPEPSATDLEHAWPWYSYLIVPVWNGRAERGRVWELSRDRRSFRELELCGR